MNITHKDATITPTGSADSFPGSFEVILSAPTLDRDGDTLLPEDWKQPLPTHITFDVDHGMSVTATVGSGAPRIDEKTGNLLVAGTYSSLPRAQEVRTLVGEGHIRTVSVAFISEPATTKDGKPRRVRELLNGAFVAIPSNREALIMSSKTVTNETTTKLGARNSAMDAADIQSIHDMSTGLGASCSAKATPAEKPAKDTEKPAKGVKAIVGSLEAERERVCDALEDAYPHAWPCIRGTLPDGNGGGIVVFDLSDRMTDERDTFSQAYADDGAMVTLLPGVTKVDIMEIVTPDVDEAPAVMTAAAALPAVASRSNTDSAARTTGLVPTAKALGATEVATPAEEELQTKQLWTARLRIHASSVPPERG